MSLHVEHLDKDYPTPERAAVRAARREPRPPARRGRGRHGAVRLRQEHAAAHPRHPRPADRAAASASTTRTRSPCPKPRLADFRNRHIGFVFQDHHLLPQCSVLENVLIPTLVGRDDRAAVKTWARQAAGARRPVRAARPPAGRAVRRRTAARGRGPGADPSPAAAAGRRADRQPRPRTAPTSRPAAARPAPRGADHPRRRHAQPASWPTCSRASSSWTTADCAPTPRPTASRRPAPSQSRRR